MLHFPIRHRVIVRPYRHWSVSVDRIETPVAALVRSSTCFPCCIPSTCGQLATAQRMRGAFSYHVVVHFWHSFLAVSPRIYMSFRDPNSAFRLISSRVSAWCLWFALQHDI